jgi:Family of unknown function (DUF6152)
MLMHHRRTFVVVEEIAPRRKCMLGRIIVIMAAVTLIVVGGERVAAHHGWSGYDSSQPLDLAGVILESGYEHPHGYLKLEAPEKVWLVVLAPPSRMERRGLPRAMLQTGTMAKVMGYPHRSEAEEMRAERITIDGKTVELR